jgi:hypothetical protein
MAEDGGRAGRGGRVDPGRIETAVRLCAGIYFNAKAQRVLVRWNEAGLNSLQRKCADSFGKAVFIRGRKEL